jgi:hypothetical protein
MSSPPALTLLIPGLIWPTAALSDLTHDLALPALCRLIEGGQRRTLPGRTLRTALGTTLGVPPPLPSAAARRLGFGLSADTGRWLCLDPVHLAFKERQLRVDDPAKLALNAEEAKALATALAPVFADQGDIDVARPDAWHLKLHPDATAPVTPALSEQIGHRADDQLAKLDRAWRQRLNEAQMILHAHPVNQAREASGQPVVNSLWPWGDGVLPPATGGASLPAIYSNSPDLIGLARHLGHSAAPLPTNAGELLAATKPHPPATPIVVGLDTLDLMARQADAQNWREKLITLEQDWFAPLYDSLIHGRLSTLQLELCGDSHCLRLVCWRTWLLLDRLRFWRAAPGNGGLAPRLDPRGWSSSP